MTECEQEAMELFAKLSPENQNHLLMLTRLAYVAECSVRKALRVPTDEMAQESVGSAISKAEGDEDARLNLK